MQMFQVLECQSLWHNKSDAAVLSSAPEAPGSVIRKPTGEASASKECNSISSYLHSFTGCMRRGKSQETLPRNWDMHNEAGSLRLMGSHLDYCLVQGATSSALYFLYWGSWTPKHTCCEMTRCKETAPSTWKFV